MTQELKACPFCGGEAEIDEIAGGMGALFFVSCKDADCCGYRIDPWLKHSRRIEAAQHWNTRTPDSVIAELVEAARKVHNGLLERIDNAPRQSVPVFAGIADLACALAKLEASK